MNRLLKVGLVTFTAAALFPIAAWQWRTAPYRDPAGALHAFKDTTRFATEDQILDPLILCGERVVPTLLDAVRDPQLPYRRYAIRFLGRYDTPEVRQRLEEIILTPAENAFVRGDALQSLWEVGGDRATTLATQFLADTTYLGRVAGWMLDTPPSDWYEQRSYLDALLGRHT